MMLIPRAIPTTMLGAWLVAQATLPVSDVELWRYAVTQGGLLIVVLVLFWAYRRDSQERYQTMVQLVSQNTSASQKAADASERVAIAVERLERLS